MGSLKQTQPSQGEKVLTYLTLIVIACLALVLRIYNLQHVPAGLFCDEAALGYNAWAILHYGIDENGTRWPLFVWSFGGYKNPIFIYSAMLPIGLLGLDEFSVRLTSALFGASTVIAVFFLGRALNGPRLGLVAAFLLAICPWHLHFSRIAFELISFPLLFVISLTFLLRFLQGKHTLFLAAIFASSCVYAYGIAKLFVPLFFAGFAAAYSKALLRRWKDTLCALLCAIIVLTPIVVFEVQHSEQAFRYIKGTFLIGQGHSMEQMFNQFLRNYVSFFSRNFLFINGDPLARHAVRHHGELYWWFAPFLAVGLVTLLFNKRLEDKLILWWLALYPIGPSLMNEAPSASRGFIGVAAFIMLTAAGLDLCLGLLEGGARKFHMRWAAVVLVILGLPALATCPLLKYLRLYFHEYPIYAAPTIGGFQYGYRQVIEYMESRRHDYSGRLMLTATDVNQPQIFTLFYLQKDPRTIAESGDRSYLILDPAEHGRYQDDQPILYALRPHELNLFQKAQVKKKIFAPGGQLEFVVAEVRKRKLYITEWLLLGLFEGDSHPRRASQELVPGGIAKQSYRGKYGRIFWQPFSSRFFRIDLNSFFAQADPKHPGNPEDVCAYALTYPVVPSVTDALLEVSGSSDAMQIWLNGVSLSLVSQRFGSHPSRRKVTLQGGQNELLVRTCEENGPWFFSMRLSDMLGGDLNDLSFNNILPEIPLPAFAPQRGIELTKSLTEGFMAIVDFQHHDFYPDYRGKTESWWTYGNDKPSDLRWRTAAPQPCQRCFIAFTASMGEAAGQAELWANGEYLLSFDLGDSFEHRLWQRGPYRLSFIKKQQVAGSSGYFVLELPGPLAGDEQPIELRVTIPRAEGNPWFMIKDYKDTIASEKLTIWTIENIFANPWQQ